MATATLSHHFTTVNGVKLHYVRQGSGEPLLLIHGWPGFWFEWHRNIAALAEHFDVIVPDMRGFAYSDKPDVAPEVGYSDTAFAEDIRAFLDFYHFDEARIVSHDFGAVWVQRFARMYPERLHKLMLFDPPYPGIGGRWFEMPQMLQTWYQIFHQQPWAEDLVGSSKKATEIYLRHFLSAWSANKQLWTDDEIAAYVEAYSQPGSLRGGFNCYRAVFRGGMQASGDLTISTPTTVLWGDSDAILPYAWSDRLPEFFPNLTLKKIEGVGHFMMREAPERINAEIIGFMKD
ncbi:MAG TPA: alpha/beta hydrolase [Dehalococcoidia bacterium]|nr:alpha/beta hydrolase [Dehalococcoidia bacterium]